MKSPWLWKSVMEFAGNDEHGTFFDFVNKSMFIGDTAGPITGKIMLERFRFPDAPERIAGDVFYKLSDSGEDFFVFNGPGFEILEGLRIEGDDHSSSNGI